MSMLSIYAESGGEPRETIRDHSLVAERLRGLGVRFERWGAARPLSADAQQEEVLKVFAEEIERLDGEYGFQSVDVVSLRPGHPQAEELRQKFLSEHTHADFEVRFFVDGSGLFYLHVGDLVYVVLCEKGDLISVPANTTHWFDMGAAPDFKCIRFFTRADGWVGAFTGSAIAASFPDFDRYRAVVA